MPTDRERAATRAWSAALAAGLLLVGGCAVAGAPAVDPAPTRSASASPTASAPASPASTTTSAAPTPAAPSGSDPDHAAAGTAADQLAALVVRGRAPMTGYARDQFGPAWLDADRNGCDTRNDVLRRDVAAATLKPGTHGCVVLTGTLADPYSGAPVAFARGAGDRVDIDHVVSLGNAWATGAWRWDVHRRAALANDPLNLLAVDSHLNRQKGDGDAATWLPPARGYRCAYVARQLAVKAKYALAVTPPERAAIARVLATCPGQPATADPTRAPTRVDQRIRPPDSSPSAAPSGGTGSAPSGRAPRGLVGGHRVTFRNCDAARAAGAAPVRRGDPGYSRALDRDGDGAGCE